MRPLILLCLILLAACQPAPGRRSIVRFPGPAGELAGEMVLPDGPGPHPAVILIAGSGAQDRDESVAGHRPFRTLAAALARAGFASLRYDKRGVRDSEGDFATATIGDFAADAAAAFDWLAARPEIDGGRIAMLGHSEGGLVAPMAAQRRKVAALVLLAGPGLKMDMVVRRQISEIARVQGTDAALIATTDAALALAFDRLRAAGSGPAARPGMADALAVLPADLRNGFLDAFASPWGHEAIRLDPARVLAGYCGPVLALWGGKDLQVDGAGNARAMRPHLRHPASRIVILPGLNHLFQRAGSGSPEEYAGSGVSPTPETTEIVAGFLRTRLQSSRGVTGCASRAG